MNTTTLWRCEGVITARTELKACLLKRQQEAEPPQPSLLVLGE